MRGKPFQDQAAGTPRRNIPAYAGKTSMCGLARFKVEEHPRVCGENTQQNKFSSARIGTSPRMRGKHLLDFVVQMFDRNIPAYAGKTSYSQQSYRKLKEHPRVCGENSGLFFMCSRSGWNIPAYAGKTGCSGELNDFVTEHPRVCGENPWWLLPQPFLSGTSPRMRGKL